MAGYLTRIVILGLVDQIRRWRLVQQGLSSGKKRRTNTDGGALAAMDRSLIVRGALYVGFSLGMLALFSGLQHVDSRAAEAVVILICGLAIFHLNHQKSAQRNGSVLLIFGGILIHLWVVKLANGVALQSDLGEHYEFLVMPIALAPMVHSVLLGQRAGVYSSVFVSLFGALTIPSDDRWAFFAISLICGLTSVFATKRVSKRGRLLRAGFWVGVMALLVDLVFAKISVSGLQMFSSESWTIFGKACLIALSTGLLTGLFVGGVLPLLEGLFGLTTEISWLELSDLNHPLLRKMQIEAPGTFHHSLIVASLAESAAEAIGADAVMSRVCAYFHDIGKLNKPEYFIENQGGMNPHDGLTPTMSALIIVAHVKDGVDLAIKNKLNPRILDVIQEHHGDSLVYYFYRKAQERLQKHEVDEGHSQTRRIQLTIAHPFKNNLVHQSPDSARRGLRNGSRSTFNSICKRNNPTLTGLRNRPRIAKTLLIHIRKIIGISGPMILLNFVLLKPLLSLAIEIIDQRIAVVLLNHVKNSWV